MARRPRLQGPGSLHHVIVRGNERRDVFLDDADRESYLDRLRRYRDRFEFRLYAFCLMTNHVHLAVEQGPVSLSRVMHALQSSYAQYFNLRHDRVGHLFQGRFRSFLVEREAYLQALFRYIHENPVRAGLTRSCAEYSWSSDRFFRTGRGPAWLDLDRSLEMLGRTRAAGIRRYRELMEDTTSVRYEEAATQAGTVKGREEFAAAALIKEGTPSRRRPGWTVERLARTVAGVEGVDLAEMTSPSRRRRLSESRTLAAYLGRWCLGISIAETARRFDRDESVLARGVARLSERISREPGLRERVECLARNAGMRD